MPEQTVPLPPEAHALVAQMIQHNYDDYAAVSQQLIEGLTDENAKLRAERDLIRANMCLALNGMYMPTSGHLLGLLWPSSEEIRQQVEGEKKVMN